MIFPMPENLQDFKKYPLTLTLIGLNVFLFIIFFSGQAFNAVNTKILERSNLELSGRIYKEFQIVSAKNMRSKLPEWLLNVDPRNSDGMTVLGVYALRDGAFLENAKNYEYAGDQIAIKRWKEDMGLYYKESQDQVLNKFGLSSLNSLSQPLTWITYQFSHSNWFHLLSNMIFLLTIGAAVEVVAGSSMLLGVYLLGGIAGGFSFLGSEAHGVIPVVGASAAVSALMGFYLVAEARRRVRYYYFFTPFKGGFGFIYMPTLLLFPLYLLSDFTATLSTPEGMGGGVAYIAHIGGSLCGVLAGFIFRIRQGLVASRE